MKRKWMNLLFEKFIHMDKRLNERKVEGEKGVIYKSTRTCVNGDGGFVISTHHHILSCPNFKIRKQKEVFGSIGAIVRESFNIRRATTLRNT
jgi:hypothetical protein